MVNLEEAPPIVLKLYNRWRKRVFANDDIVCKPSREFGNEYWDLIITRGNKEAVLTVAPNAYGIHNFMLNADEAMRYALRIRS